MNKEEFLMILESALLCWDYKESDVLIQKYNIPEEYAKIGFKLVQYLKNKKINREVRT